MARPTASMSSTRQDYGTVGTGTGGEKGTWGVPVPAINAGNIAATNTALAALRLAVEGLTLGEEVHATTTSFIFDATAEVTDPLAQRENKWLVRYHDPAGNKFQVELPCAKLALLDTGTEFLDLTGTEAAAFVTAFEAIVVSPLDASTPVVVDSIQYVSRRG